MEWMGDEPSDATTWYSTLWTTAMMSWSESIVHSCLRKRVRVCGSSPTSQTSFELSCVSLELGHSLIVLKVRINCLAIVNGVKQTSTKNFLAAVFRQKELEEAGGAHRQAVVCATMHPRGWKRTDHQLLGKICVKKHTNISNIPL